MPLKLEISMNRYSTGIQVIDTISKHIDYLVKDYDRNLLKITYESTGNNIFYLANGKFRYIAKTTWDNNFYNLILKICIPDDLLSPNGLLAEETEKNENTFQKLLKQEWLGID